MIRRFTLMLLLLLTFAMTGCSDGNLSAPTPNQAHPFDWITMHPEDALAVAEFADCIFCHGADLQGKEEVIGCYSCHAFNTTPPFIIHPTSWNDPYINHRSYAAAKEILSCAMCHGSDLQGSLAAPSCFSSGFNGGSCHADGPGHAPHPVDGTFLDGANHGHVAKADLTFCQACHGQPGGPGSNPRFYGGIRSDTDTGCEGCHGVNYAHPADWTATRNGPFHGSSGNIQKSCTLCHGINLDGVDGIGISCLRCHGSINTLTP